MIIKVCGMRDPENIRQICQLNIQWMGFIFYPHSPRYVQPKTEEMLLKPSFPVKKVGVFVNATHEEMLEAATQFRLDYLQLHGEETPDACYALQKRGIALIKALPVETEEDLRKTTEYEGYVDYFLFDTRCKSYGGSGKSFDWSLLQAYAGETPFLLSGGISPEHISALRDFKHPRLAGIDLNSGFEIEPGLKDIEKIKKFITHNF